MLKQEIIKNKVLQFQKLHLIFHIEKLNMFPSITKGKFSKNY